MSGKKKALMGLLLVLLVITVAAGIKWNRDNFVMVDLHFYPKNQEVLDLRKENLPSDRFDKLVKKLPRCRILWNVPLSGGGASNDAQILTVTALTAEDVELLDYLEELKTVEADGCQDYESLLALEQRRPELELRYRVTLGSSRFDRDAEEITVKNVTEGEVSRLDCMKKLKSVICAGGQAQAAATLREACVQRGIGFCIRIGDQLLDQEVSEVTAENAAAEELPLLGSLPQLETVHLVRPQASAGELMALAERLPQTQVTWEVEIFGALCSSAAQELDLSEAQITTLDQIDEAMVWFPKTQTVFLGKTKLNNETLASWREQRREQYKLVWTVQLGDKLTARTDDTTFMPVREYVYYFNDAEAYNLRYCEDMVCIDIGHMSIHNIDFVEFMPNLTYLILAHTQLSYIDPISSCKNLKFLELDWAPLRDLSPLVGCSALEDLNLGNTYASFEPIKEMTWLKNLWVIGCNGGTAYKLSQALPDTKVQGSGSATVDSGWRDLPNYYAMRDVLGMHYMGW